MASIFRGTWSLVTGASSGIGEELARQIAARGGHVVLTARSEDKLRALAASIGAANGTETRVVAADLATDAGLAALFAGVESHGLAIDHVFANAGFGSWGAFVEQTTASQTEMVRLNCESLVGLVHHFVVGMVARGKGGVVLVASTASFQPTPFFATYGATKAFVRSFGEALADEVRPHGVRVQIVCPGPVHTGFQSRAGATISESQRSSVLTAEECARRSLDAYERRGGVFVPGAMNRIGAALATAMPNALVVPVVRRMMQKKSQIS